MEARDIVRRLHNGQQTGPRLEVVRIGDHTPVDGPAERNVIAYLHDGSWEFVWNLVVVGRYTEEG